MAVRQPKSQPVLIAPPETGPFRLRVGNAYQSREEGFVHIDRVMTENVDHLVDLLAPPWPIDDGVVDTIFAGFYFHRLIMEDRFTFMSECGRILKIGAQLVMQVPYWSSRLAISDPYAKWPPVCEESFAPYSKQFREQEKLLDLGLTCDFGMVFGVGHDLDPDLIPRNEDFQNEAKKFKTNAIHKLHVTLTRAS